MNVKSFRLSQEAQENLKKWAEEFDLSESRIVNILLTEHRLNDFSLPDGYLTLKKYFEIKGMIETAKQEAD